MKKILEIMAIIYEYDNKKEKQLNNLLNIESGDFYVLFC